MNILRKNRNRIAFDVLLIAWFAIFSGWAVTYRKLTQEIHLNDQLRNGNDKLLICIKALTKDIANAASNSVPAPEEGKMIRVYNFKESHIP